MTDDRWPRVKALFQAAVERPGDERDAFLAAATGDDEALRRDVESLLAADASDSELPRSAALVDESVARRSTGRAGVDGRPAASRRPQRWSSRRSLRSRGPARCGRHGRGVPRARHKTESRRRPEGVASAFRASIPTGWRGSRAKRTCSPPSVTPTSPPSTGSRSRTARRHWCWN